METAAQNALVLAAQEGDQKAFEALVLSLWLSILLATALAYSSWLLLLVLSTGYLDILLSLSGELLLGGVGIVMLVITLWRFTLQIPRHLLATAP